MAETWIVNASPLIVLAKAGYLELMGTLPASFVIPEPVVIEIVSGPANDPARRAIESGWGVRRVTGIVPDELRAWGLGPGETAVIAIAREIPDAVAVLDDSQGRMCATALGVPVIGTLGILARAARRRLVPTFTDAARALQAAGLYIDSKLIDAVSRSLGRDKESSERG